jgi:hypothetical protein
MTKGEDIRTAIDDSGVSASGLAARTTSLLRTSAHTSPYVVSWYLLPGSIKSQPALASEYLITPTDPAPQELYCIRQEGRGKVSCRLH